MFDEKKSEKESSRIEAFSDGVFAIAITLLILEIKVPSHAELREGLFKALLCKWPSYLAFFIGFFTVLVCWINHHYLFNRITGSSHSLILANGFTLFLVSFVPFPTAVLSEAFIEGDLQTAIQLFGLTFFLMSLAYRILSSFVDNDKHKTYSPEEKKNKNAFMTMYGLALVHTSITFFVAYFSVFVSLLSYTLLFSMFCFPVWYTNLIIKLNRKNSD